MAQAAVKFGEEMKQGDTAIILFQATEDKDGAFSVGVRTAVKADHAFVEVFYKMRVPGIKSDLLLHQESLAPVAGNLGYGATNQNFTMPRASVQFVRVTFFSKVAKEVEFK
jgi:hypothetical protein